VSLFRSRLLPSGSTSSENHIPGIGLGPTGMLSTPSALLTTVKEQRLRKILQAIEVKPSRNIPDLAQEFNLSPSHLQHLFKQHTGVCLGCVIKEQRLQRAADLLANSNLSVKEIAFVAGYEHTSSFIRAFERRFLQAPRCYRQTR